MEDKKTVKLVTIILQCIIIILVFFQPLIMFSTEVYTAISLFFTDIGQGITLIDLYKIFQALAKYSSEAKDGANTLSIISFCFAIAICAFLIAGLVSICLDLSIKRKMEKNGQILYMIVFICVSLFCAALYSDSSEIYMYPSIQSVLTVCLMIAVREVDLRYERLKEAEQKIVYDPIELEQQIMDLQRRREANNRRFVGENEINSSFVSGNIVSADSKENSNKARYCSNCQQSYDSNVIFCPHCGRKTDE